METNEVITPQSGLGGIRNLCAAGGHAQCELSQDAGFQPGEIVRRTFESIRLPDVSLHTRNMLERAGLLPQYERFRFGIRRMWAASMGHIDAMRIYTASMKGEQLAVPLEFQEIHAYCMLQRMGMSRDQAWEAIKEKAIERLKDQEPLIITTETIQKPEELLTIIKRSVKRQLIVQIDSETPEAEAQIYIAVQQALAVLGVDEVYTPVVGNISHLTPYEIIDFAEKAGRVLPRQAEVLTEIVQNGFHELREALEDIRPLLPSLFRNRHLTDTQKRDVVLEILNAVGCPGAEIERAFELIDTRRAGKITDLHPIAEIVGKTAYALRDIDATMPRQLAHLVAELSSRSDEALAEILETFEIVSGIEHATVHAATNQAGASYKIRLAISNAFSIGTGIPDPMLSRHDFLIHIADNIKNYIWLRGMGAFTAAALAMTAGIVTQTTEHFQVLQASLDIPFDPEMFSHMFHYLGAIIPFYMAPEAVPNLGRLSLGPQAIKKFPNIPLLGAILSIWPEWLGLGVGPAGWSKNKAVAWRPWMSTLGRTLVLDRKATMIFYNASGGEQRLKDDTGTIGQKLGAPKWIRERIIHIAMSDDRPFSHLFDELLCWPIPILNIPFNPPWLPLGDMHGKYSWVKKPWKLKAHGVIDSSGLPVSELTRLGLIEIVAALITKKVQIAKTVDQIPTSHELSDQPYEMKAIPRLITQKLADFWITGFVNIPIQFAIAHYLGISNFIFEHNSIRWIPYLHQIADPQLALAARDTFGLLLNGVGDLMKSSNRRLVNPGLGADDPNPYIVQPGNTPAPHQDLLNSGSYFNPESDVGHYIQYHNLQTDLAGMWAEHDGQVFQLLDGSQFKVPWNELLCYDKIPPATPPCE